VLRQRLAGENPTNELGSPQSEIDIKISEYQSQLSQLQLRFTDRHPDVIATKRTLEQLEQRRREQLDALTSDDGIGVASDNPVFQNLQIELTNVNVELATLNEKRTTLVKRVRQLEESVDILPQIEADLARLTRDYNVKQAQYQALLERLEMAELSESAEQSEDVRFRIIDPPSYSSDPVAPNRPLLLVGTFLASLAASGFVAFLLNQVNPVFSDSRSVRVVTSLPILGSVQVLNSTEHRRWRRGQLTAFAFGILSLFIVFVVVFLLHDAGSRALQSII
jgi:polysaccharide chain length determinant protein (PEP-CTERM system associated)